MIKRTYNPFQAPLAMPRFSSMELYVMVGAGLFAGFALSVITLLAFVVDIP